MSIWISQYEFNTILRCLSSTLQNYHQGKSAHWYNFWITNVLQGLNHATSRPHHYSDAIMSTMGSQITSLTIVYSTVYSSAGQRKHEASASLAFVWGIHRSPVNSPHKGPIMRKIFSFDDVIMHSHAPTNGDVWIIPSFRISGYAVCVAHVWCVITNCGQYQWVIPFLSIALQAFPQETLSENFYSYYIFRLVLQNVTLPGCFPCILFYRYLFSLISSGWFVIAVCGSISVRELVQ